MTFSFRPAVRERTPLMIGLAGPSSGGKTYSALRLATGLAEGRPIVLIDTENGRALHYADRFQFQHGHLPAPFTPARYVEAIQAAQKLDPGAIIIDSASHMHEGAGGVLEMHEAALQRMAGDDWRKRESCKFAAWIEPKREVNRFVNTVLQISTHLIFCFRAKDKLALVRNDRGKQEPVSQGWQPIITDRFEYEMTTLLVLPPGARGVPDLQEKATRLTEQLAPLVPAGEQINEDTGRRLAGWASGPKPQSAPEPEPLDVACLSQYADAAARQGTAVYKAFWRQQSDEARTALKPEHDNRKKTAEEVDRIKAGTDAAPAR